MNIMLMSIVHVSIKNYFFMICFMDYVYAGMIVLIITNGYTWKPSPMEVLPSSEYDIIIIINNFYNYLSIAIDR